MGCYRRWGTAAPKNQYSHGKYANSHRPGVQVSLRQGSMASGLIGAEEERMTGRWSAAGLVRLMGVTWEFVRHTRKASSSWVGYTAADAAKARIVSIVAAPISIKSYIEQLETTDFLVEVQPP